MDISLSPELERFLQDSVKSGKYPDASAIVEDALGLLRITPRSLDELREMVQVGVEEAGRGETEPLDTDAIKAEGRTTLRQQR